MTRQLAHRSRMVGAANRVLPAVSCVTGAASRDLDADILLERASAATGLDDFGDPWFNLPLRILIDALHRDAALNPVGRVAAVGQLRKVLADRLHAEQLFRTWPEIEQRKIRSPVIVVGAMRSGTTRLHRLIAADCRFSHLRAFETICPVPNQCFVPGGTDRRWLLARLGLGAVHAFNPVTALIHPTGPFEPEEELGLLVRSIWGMKHEVQWRIPEFSRWSEGEDAFPAYRYMARLLRLVGWARGEDDTRPWVLKTPQHMLDLPALLRVFPDACIVFAHRDPRAVVGSTCSLVWNQMVIHSDNVDAHGIGREWLRKTELQVARMCAARGVVPRHRRIDVLYEEVESDWQGVMRRIYRVLGLDIEPALPAMMRYADRAERARIRRPHRYSLSDFGLDAGDVDERFETYRDTFALTVRGAEASVNADTAVVPHGPDRPPLASRSWMPRRAARAVASKR